MRIIIVGIHNKEGLKPLDSSSQTGQLIDRIAEQLPLPIEKTNLFNIDYMPKDKAKKQELVNEWFWSNLPTDDDLIVQLGGDVEKEFKHEIKKVIKITHPGYIIRGFGKISKEEYVSCAVAKIKKYCN
jgi:hypothetical protein